MLGSLKKDQVGFLTSGVRELVQRVFWIDVCSASSCVCITQVRHLRGRHGILLNTSKCFILKRSFFTAQLRWKEASTSLFPDLGDKKKGVHCFIALGEMMDPALFLRAFSPEVCRIPALSHARNPCEN